MKIDQHYQRQRCSQ